MNLVNKYNVAAPRYTSYPTVPFWNETPGQQQWQELVSASFKKTNSADGLSLYIHLPFCESLCTYCACNTRITVNHKVEIPYLETVLKEWQLYLGLFDEKPKIKQLHLGGGTPTFFSAENLHRLIKGILNDAIIADRADFSFEGHPSNTTAEHLQTLYGLGFRRVSFGIQDFDLKVQDTINRYQSFEEVESVVALARMIGYTSVNFDLVYGLPFQSLQTITETVEKVVLLKPDRVAFYSYAHVPWLKPGQRKFTENDLPADLEKRNLYQKGLEMLQGAGYEDVGMDHFALKHDPLFIAAENKTLHRNFMGYTDHYTELMISLGASAISDTLSSFGQNIKAVEPYQEAVRGGKFPIFKGHILSKEDLFLRGQILNIMCKGETTWIDGSKHAELLHSSIKKCVELQQDGLVKLGKNELSVTEAGKAYLRNICMCFDDYLEKKVGDKLVFSTAV